MKIPLKFLLTFLFCPCVMAQLPPQGGLGMEFLPAERKAPVGKAAGDDELIAQRNSAKFGGLAPEEPAPKGWDLLEYSDFIGIEGNYVILPKNSVIHVPDSLKACILPAPAGNMMTWSEMLIRYRGMVTCIEVGMEEVTGQKPIFAERLEAVIKIKRIVVAVYGNSPITVIRPAVETASVEK